MSTQPSNCCLTAFRWGGAPIGRETTLASNKTYKTSAPNVNPKTAILLIHYLFGWEFPNLRLLADHYAIETNSTVYLPDFFGGMSVNRDDAFAGRFDKIDLKGFIAKSSREIREPEIFACAKALKDAGNKVAAIGFCYGRWAVFRLGAKEHNPPLVDCISAGHPSLLTKQDIDEEAVPVQLLAPEFAKGERETMA
jgi:dienelactone hydrolase